MKYELDNEKGKRLINDNLVNRSLPPRSFYVNFHNKHLKFPLRTRKSTYHPMYFQEKTD